MTLDLRGLICPMPLIRLTASMEALAAGERCQVLADDPGFAEDLPDWCRKTGHQLILLANLEDGSYQAEVEKRGLETN